MRRSRPPKTRRPCVDAMSDANIVAVVGATGAQGGGLIRSILADVNRRFCVRALTRNPASAAARELAARGAEVVFADADRPDSLRRAFAGARAAFCVTNFWEHLSPDRELEQAAALAAAVGCAPIEHLIWSTLEDTRRWVPLDDGRMPTLMGRYKVPHFDAKGEADAIFLRAGVPVTFLRTSFYYDNFINFPGMCPARGSHGQLELVLPMADKRLPCIAAEDIGQCAYGILVQEREYVGRTVGIAGAHLTGTEIAAALTRAVHRPVAYVDVNADAYRALGFRAAAELGNMFQFKRDFQEDFCGIRDVALSRRLNPSLQTFDAWLARNGSRIPVR
jgi:uncharacterized protein YbjT (DUF2867 family)